MKEFLRHLMTGVDNHTYDLARVLGLFMGVQFIALAAYAVCVNKQPFGPMEYGGGAGAVLTAIGIAVNLKSRSEPKGGA